MRAGGKREPRATRTGTSTPLRCDMWQVWTLQAQAPPTLERWAPAPGARQCLRNSRGAQWGLRAQQAEGLWSGMFWNLRGRHATPSLSERKSQHSWVQMCPQGLLRQGSSAPPSRPAPPEQRPACRAPPTKLRVFLSGWDSTCFPVAPALTKGWHSGPTRDWTDRGTDEHTLGAPLWGVSSLPRLPLRPDQVGARDAGAART